MSGVSNVLQQIGYPQIAGFDTAQTTEVIPTGTVVAGTDPYWGPREYVFCYATGTVDHYGCVAISQSLVNGRFRWEATAVANTANLGRPVGFSMVNTTVGQYVWVCVRGLVPVQATASVAADTAFGIVAPGKTGAPAAGKQILNARNVLPATTTVVKANCFALSGSNILRVQNADGWFIGAYLSGTGVAAGARILAISPNGTEVTMSGNASAQITGSVTATYNNASVFFNVANICYPFAQGAIT